jgi:hypothetical protein
MENAASVRVQDGERGSIRLEVLVDCVLFARDQIAAAAWAARLGKIRMYG